MKYMILLIIVILLFLTQITTAQIPQLISYQGILTDPDDNPVPDGNYDLTFKLYDVKTGGTALWIEDHLDVTIFRGRFSVILGSVNPLSIQDVQFDKPYFLGITVDGIVELEPRTLLTASPYSLNTRTVFDGSITNSKLATGSVTGDKIGEGQVVRSLNNLTDDVALIAGPNISITSDSNSLTISAPILGKYWKLDGNLGTNPAVNFLGTIDDVPLELRVKNARVFQFEPNSASPNLIGGFFGNNMLSGVFGGTVSGGGTAGNLNHVTDNFGTIGGGANNMAGDNSSSVSDAIYGTVSGGYGNIAGGDYTTVAGGHDNLTSDDSSTVSGGGNNKATAYMASVGGGSYNEAGGTYSTISGGRHSTSTHDYASIGGGYGNRVLAQYGTIAGGGITKPDAPDTGNKVTDDFGTIGGGSSNQAGNDSGETTDAIFTTISGGYFNVAKGHYATVPGGNENIAQGEYSFAAGRRAKAFHHGCFVWGDANNLDISSTAANQFIARAYGGSYFYTDHGAFRLEPHGLSPNLVGGHVENMVSSGVYGGTIGGGGASGYSNKVTDIYCTVAGGWDNQAGNDSGAIDDAWHATVGGGSQNISSAPHSTVAGGKFNQADDKGTTVSGGESNKASGECSTIGGGYYNETTKKGATVGGGYDNKAIANYATIGGGHSNEASRDGATVGGGTNNIADGGDSTVPGGKDNEANGEFSFAAGHRAKAENGGCFVWGDLTNQDVSSTDINQFIVRASGGIYLYTNNTLTSGLILPAGSSSWSIVSDREAKRNINHVDCRDIMSRLAKIPISRWSYKSQDPGIEHLGPMAQDFYEAFKLGDNEKRIYTIDLDGVALAAIKGLYEIVEEKDAKIAAQQEKIASLEERIDKLEALIK